MKGELLRLAGGIVLFLTLSANGAVLYVDVNSAAPAPPYTDWSTAAVTIQDAVDASAAGDEIEVTNGVYQTGGRVAFGALTNRVAVTKAVTVRSVKGPDVTIIRGAWAPGTTNGDGAVRCVYLTNGAALIGFTLTNGATRAAGDSRQEQSGGGVWCASASGLVSNCVLAGNSAYWGGGGAYSNTLSNCILIGNSVRYSGGGAYSGTLNNCTLTGNTALGAGVMSGSGGGAYSCTLNNCTVIANSADGDGGGAVAGKLNNCTLTGNSAHIGGGANGSALNNCIVYYNQGCIGPNCWACTLNYCCTTPLPGNGTGNTDADPQLANASHLSSASPCRGTGSAAYTSGVDIDGESWANPPSMGCDEFYAGSATGALSVSIQTAFTKVAAGFGLDLTAGIGGRVATSQWDFGDGTVVSNRPYVSHAWNGPGDYAVVLSAYNSSNPSGASVTVTVHVVAQPVHYVALSSPGPLAPYSSWTTAARKIQDAVDAAVVPGAMVLVTNGVYGVGGRVVYGAMQNRVAVTMPLVVQSVNGPGVTVIHGYQVPGTTNGNAAVRCAYLTNGATLAGFTLTNGATRASGDFYLEESGGGVWCASLSAMVSNCVLVGNSAYFYGGGAYFGILNNCTFTSNIASSGGGAYFAALSNCTLTGNSASYLYNGYGGGACNSTLNNCTLTGNSAQNGGGASFGTLNNCTLAGNSAVDGGGGACNGTLNNCTLTGNSVLSEGGGMYQGTLNNCTLMNNSAYIGGGANSATLNNCTLMGNSAAYGGGASSATLNNCTLTGNPASLFGGGANESTLNNCILWYNSAPADPDYSGGTLNYCCTPLLPGSGGGNIGADPQLASTSHLGASSPCRGAGSPAYTSGVDIDGEPWASAPSMGCDEGYAGSATGGLSVSLQVAYTNVATGFAVDLTASVGGRVTASRWEFGDGTVVSNRPYAAHAWGGPGDYAVVLRAYITESFS